MTLIGAICPLVLALILLEQLNPNALKLPQIEIILLRRLLFLLLTGSPLIAAEPLVSIAAIRALSPQEASLEVPVHIEGVVTYCEPGYCDLFVQDATAGSYVEARSLLPHMKIRAGDRLRIDGATRRGGFFSDIVAKKIDVLGNEPLPAPRLLKEDELLAPSVDSQWLELPAVVIGVENDGLGQTLSLVLEVHGWKLKAEVPRDENSEQNVAKLMQRAVRFRGVAGTVFNQQMQMVDRFFYVPSIDQIKPTDALSLMAAAPLRATSDLLRYDDAVHTVVRVEGVVTHATEREFYLRDGSGSVLVQKPQTKTVRPGDRVRAEGFAAIAPFRPMLRARTVAVLGHTELPIPHPLDLNNQKLPLLQAELVTLEADFLTRRDSPGEVLLQCCKGDRYFEGTLSGSGIVPKSLVRGDHVRLTGICELTTTRPMPRPDWVDGFRLRLLESAGIEILHHPPWWTLQRLMIALGVAATLACGFLGWIWMLRRRVAEQTEIIGAQFQREAIQGERQRIARELHDTVEQGLSGLSMQLGSISGEISRRTPSKIEETIEHVEAMLNLAQKLLHYCRKEARISIHDLRCIELEQRGLPGALRELLPSIAQQSGAKFDLVVSGDPHPLETTVENHLLRIAQESVANCAQHAAPSEIAVGLHYTSSDVTLEIRDNGCGFPPTAPPPEGHFGILGIRERAKKIRAKLAIESAPGNGTTVRVVRPTPKQP